MRKVVATMAEMDIAERRLQDVLGGVSGVSVSSSRDAQEEESGSVLPVVFMVSGGEKNDFEFSRSGEEDNYVSWSKP